MADLIAMQPNLNIPLYLVAPDERRAKVIAEVNRPTFSRLTPPLNRIRSYISFSTLRQNMETARAAGWTAYLKPDFLQALAELCLPDEVKRTLCGIDEGYGGSKNPKWVGGV